MQLKKNWLEWAVFALGAVLIAGVGSVLTREALRDSGSPPRLELKIKTAQRSGAHWVVPVEVKNSGAQTAEGVQLEVIAREGKNEETAEFEIAFVPRASQREGFAVFTRDPKNAHLEARVRGFKVP